MTNDKKTVVSGIRATGRLHLGNYLGVLERFARMSQDEELQCFFFIADLHTLTTPREGLVLGEHLPEIVLDFLAAGVDPDRASIYAQSSIPEVTELTWYLDCLTGFNHLSGLPTWKDKATQMETGGRIPNVGLFNYPVLMAADILGPKAHLVPVGEDQRPHLELAQRIARQLVEVGVSVPIPDGLIEEMIRVPGLSAVNDDGSFPKMGKSDENTIDLQDSEEKTWEKIRVAPTDPNRVRRTDPGNPDRCAIYALHQLLSSGDELAWARAGCQRADIGCIECKQVLTTNINERLSEFRERRRTLSNDDGMMRDVLVAGRETVAPIIRETIGQVREAMGIRTWEEVL